MIRMLIQVTSSYLVKIPQLIPTVHIHRALALKYSVFPALTMDIPFALTCVGYVVLRCLSCTSFTSLFGLTYGIPTLIAALFLRRVALGMSTIERAAWATSCLIAIVLFSGVTAAAGTFFSAYWVIPALFLWAAPQSRVGQALSASFIAHLVGSWCYVLTVPTTALFWNALIPIVAAERLQHALLLWGALTIRAYGSRMGAMVRAHSTSVARYLGH